MQGTIQDAGMKCPKAGINARVKKKELKETLRRILFVWPE